MTGVEQKRIFYIVYLTSRFFLFQSSKADMVGISRLEEFIVCVQAAHV